MKIVKLSDLVPGIITEAGYRTEKGEMLLAKGVTITQQHIDLLKRRNVFELYLSGDDDELQKILSTDLTSLDELDLDDKPTLTPEEEQELLGTAKALELPEFKSIKPGAEGVEQLNKSKRAAELDRKFKLGRTPDRPIGTALKNNLKEMTPKDRTDEYKKRISAAYDATLNKVKRILNAIANGDNVEVIQIRSIVEEVIKKFITDKNIILNLSTNRSNDNIYIYNHTLNVFILAINIATAAGYNKEQVIEIGIGALLYDVGMLLVTKEIYSKEGKLTKDEWFEIKKHPIFGIHLLERVTKLPESIPYMAYQSHERENANGYPKKRNKRFIHCFSKIIQIADIFIALSSPRSYRNEYIPYKAMETIIKMTQQGMICGEFVKAFLTYSSLFPVGSLVELNDNRIGKVIKANGTSFAKPTVSILTDIKGKPLMKEDIFQFDLSEETDKHVIRALRSDYLPEANIMDGF